MLVMNLHVRISCFRKGGINSVFQMNKHAQEKLNNFFKVQEKRHRVSQGFLLAPPARA